MASFSGSHVSTKPRPLYTAPSGPTVALPMTSSDVSEFSFHTVRVRLWLGSTENCWKRRTVVCGFVKGG